MNRINMLGAATAVFGRIANARRRRQTLRVLDSLPDHLRKDIGWSSDHRWTPTYLLN
jgi:uncharacterized protein YjiS (DUF1127 family)